MISTMLSLTCNADRQHERLFGLVKEVKALCQTWPCISTFIISFPPVILSTEDVLQQPYLRDPASACVGA